ncbi:MAG: hypothetical protein ABI128_02435 [Rhodanobacter sp.]
MLKASPDPRTRQRRASAQQISRQQGVLRHIQARQAAERLTCEFDTPVAKVATVLIAEAGRESRRRRRAARRGDRLTTI